MAVDNGSMKYIKFGVLIALCVQNCCYALLTRYSKSVLRETWSEYEAVMMSEVMKLVVAGFLMMYDTSESDAVGTGFQRFLWLVWNGKK